MKEHVWMRISSRVCDTRLWKREFLVLFIRVVLPCGRPLTQINNHLSKTLRYKRCAASAIIACSYLNTFWRATCEIYLKKNKIYSRYPSEDLQLISIMVIYTPGHLFIFYMKKHRILLIRENYEKLPKSSFGNSEKLNESSMFNNSNKLQLFLDFNEKTHHYLHCNSSYVCGLNKCKTNNEPPSRRHNSVSYTTATTIRTKSMGLSKTHGRTNSSMKIIKLEGLGGRRNMKQGKNI